MPTRLPSIAAGMTTNDSIEIATDHDGDAGPWVWIPAGQTWVFKGWSEQYYTPREHGVNNTNAIDPQSSMFHIVKRVDNHDVVLYTQMIRTQQVPCPDGKPYYDYRNEIPWQMVPLQFTGPCHVRCYLFNHTGWSVVFYLAWEFEVWQDS